MRLFAPERTAMRSTRAPPRPKRENSSSAASRMRFWLRRGSRRARGSVDRGTDFLGDLADFRHLFGEEAAKLLRRAGRGVGAERDEALADFRLRHGLDDLGVQPLDGLARRPGGRKYRL